MRHLKNPWSDAWEEKGSPGALPMPYQGLLVGDALRAVSQNRLEDLVYGPVGQGIGLLDEIRPDELEDGIPPYYRPAKDSEEYQYMMGRRRSLDGSLPHRQTLVRRPLPQPRLPRLCPSSGPRCRRPSRQARPPSTCRSPIARMARACP